LGDVVLGDSSEEHLPFSRYDDGGRRLLEKPRARDGTCRHGYGPDVFRQCGTTCVYCGRELSEPYTSWLDISVDHVVPVETIKRLGYPSEWVDDLINLVTCCRACNEFLNGHRVLAAVPATLDEFLDIRDRVFVEKRRHALKCHQREQLAHRKWLETRNPRVPFWGRMTASIRRKS
jgi:hypothetical protein